ncbi:MAG TPA: ribosome-associated translation inhibitor RaiA [Verrucomicrobiae bacterium]|nr:ribosome-associated translation inhibitor RaiA [Verrucomicrobiae bacterium]
MHVNITARHLRLTPAIAEYVQKKLEKAKRYFDQLIRVQVILDVEKERHIAEIVIHAAGRTVTAKEESSDLYAAIDLASDKVDEQLRRYKEKRRVHRPEHRSRSRPESWAPPSLPELMIETEHRVSSMRTLRLTPMSVPEAVSAMEQSDSAHWIFVNKDNRRVTVLYRKPDKTYGVVEAL